MEDAPADYAEPRLETLALDGDTSLSVAPGLGCNLVSWKHKGVELLYTPAGFLDTGNHLDGGNPLLLPAVGRTWNTGVTPPRAGEYTVHGMPDRFHMPSHGIADRGEWIEVGKVLGNADATVEYAFTPNKEVKIEHYPFSVEFSVRYTLRHNSVEIEVTASNSGDMSAPVAIGFHPYFAVTDKRKVSISVPCSRRIVLDDELVLPTGETRPRAGSTIELDPEKTYDMAFDGVNGPRATIHRAHSGIDLHVDTDEQIETYVVYSGPNPAFVCVEPWTRGLGGFSRLSQPGWEHGNEIPVLPPGETRSVTISYVAERTVP